MAKTKAENFTNSKEKILDAAITIFSKHGFNGARTRDLADLAKVNIATLHYHFKSKDNIYGCVIKQIVELSNKDMMPVMIEQKRIIENSKNKKEIIEAIKIMTLAFIAIITNPNNRRYSKIIALEQIDQSKHFKIIFESIMTRVCEPFLHAIAKILQKRSDAIEVILLTHSIHSMITALQNNRSSLFYLSGWKEYNDDNIKAVKKNILSAIDSLLKPYL